MLRHYINVYERLNKTDSTIFVSLMCSLLSEDLYSELILSTCVVTGITPIYFAMSPKHVAAIQRLRIHQHSIDYIFSDPFWD